MERVPKKVKKRVEKETVVVNNTNKRKFEGDDIYSPQLIQAMQKESNDKREYKRFMHRLTKNIPDDNQAFVAVFNTDDILSHILSFCPLESMISLYLSCTSMKRNLHRIYKGDSPPKIVSVSDYDQLFYLATFKEKDADPNNMVSLVWRSVASIRIDMLRPKWHNMQGKRGSFVKGANVNFIKKIIDQLPEKLEMTPPNLKHLIINAWGRNQIAHPLCAFNTTAPVVALDIDVY